MTKRVDTPLARKRRESKKSREEWERTAGPLFHAFMVPLILNNAGQSRRMYAALWRNK